MKTSIKIWHAFFLLWTSIFIIHFDRILNLFQLSYFYIDLLINEHSIVIEQTDFRLLDHLVSSLLLIILPIVILLLVRNKQSFIRSKVILSQSFVMILIFIFLFTPIISYEHPDFYKDISVTKLLPPFSSVNEITLKSEQTIGGTAAEKFLVLKNQLVKQQFDNSILYCDSLKVDGLDLVYYQNNKTKRVVFANIETINRKMYLFGTDEFGRDIYSRLLFGARLSLFIGTSAVLISLIIGLLLGFVAGYKGGWINIILNRITDLFLAFPLIFLIVLILALFGNNFVSVIIVLGFSGWMSLFKIVKSEVATIKEKDFFKSSMLLGLPLFTLLKKEVLPLILASVLVNIAFQFANVVLAESALSYLGLGVGGEYPSWGSMIQSGQSYISKSWWMVILPSIFLVFTLFTLNELGKKINEYYNPRLKND